MPSLAVHTFGCKLNQLESEAIAAAFRDEGFQLVPWGFAADILVVNTCTVTSKAEQKARRVIRKALKDNPASFLIVTGCYAQLDAPAIAALEAEISDVSSPGGRLLVVPGDLKSALLDLPRHIETRNAREAGQGEPLAPREGALLTPRDGNTNKPWWIQGLDKWRGEHTGPASKPAGDPFAFNTASFSFHSRPSLKIQDGCDHICSYCRVTLARGKSLSLDAGAVLTRLKALEERGYAEAVLTGVNINQYRDEQAGGAPLDLAGLLDFLLRGTSRIALRLSSLEPEGITGEFLSVLENPRIRPHFHLSVQSGSGEILKRMRRWYSAEDIRNTVRELRARREDPFIACDIITGFPGETEAEFRKTYDLCERLDFAWIHAFPYSRRPGTEAAGFKEAVREKDAAERVEALLALARQGREGYARRWLGKTVEVITEAPGSNGGAYTPGVSGNYLRLMIPVSGGTGPLPPGTILRCRIGAPPEAGNSRFDAVAGEIELL
jgi:threonylcarbamoyladenosine tRNA methylthiotransferase MtaB